MRMKHPAVVRRWASSKVQAESGTENGAFT